MEFSSLTQSINSNLGGLNPLLRVYEHEWIESAIQILEEEDEEYCKQPPARIFTVPKTLLSDKAEAYVPHLVAIGPYHQKQLDLYPMMRYKISSAKRTQKVLKTRQIRDVVQHFREMEYRIRACYDKFIDFSGETLGWMMAVDASFLLEYLQTYTKVVTFTEVPNYMSHLVDCSRRKSGHQTILRDIIMLENQIPLFVLKEFLSFCQIEKPNEFLAETLKDICKVLSPIKSMGNFPSRNEELFERSHLLDLLYHTLLPCSKGEGMVVIEIEDQEEKKHALDDKGDRKEAFSSVLTRLASLLSAPTRYLKQAAISKEFSVLVKLPWQVAKKVTHSSKGKTIENLVALVEEVTEEVDMIDAKEPPIDEIVIPSVTELSNVGIKFCPTKGGLNATKFDKGTATLFLPPIVMDENSDVVLRNLVSYESSVAPEIMALSRYIELMNGIIDTEEDVKLLKESGIILNHLKGDMEVANMWNSMSKSVNKTKVPVLDDAIESINTFYFAKLKVKVACIMKKYVFNSWKCLVFLAANFFLLLTTVQAICSVYECKGLTYSS
ncbi:hypothetical protein MRB53_013784 [Persea americana]|uniref:Uncharacterized protein n=1 Tax=Persea americana TaxID=3435 RepID=A0ACC2K982_PERAE|nr:hypothetical protein MRB53_013784 [Persea americana]